MDVRLSDSRLPIALDLCSGIYGDRYFIPMFFNSHKIINLFQHIPRFF